MTVELCLESAGVVTALMDSGYQHAFGVVLGRGRRASARTARQFRESQQLPSPEVTARVLAAADDLPFAHVRALWLVDVCDFNYDDASAAMGISRTQFAARIADARSNIAAQLSE